MVICFLPTASGTLAQLVASYVLKQQQLLEPSSFSRVHWASLPEETDICQVLMSLNLAFCVSPSASATSIVLREDLLIVVGESASVVPSC